jgi:hypothetical protein
MNLLVNVLALIGGIVVAAGFSLGAAVVLIHYVAKFELRRKARLGTLTTL